MITRHQVAEAARSLLDVPYRHQGRHPKRGVDCIGFVWCVGEKIGYAPEIPSDYMGSPSGDLLLSYVTKYLTKTDRTTVKDLKEGDIVVLLGIDWEPQHFAIVGLYGTNKTMIHAFVKMGKVVEHRWDAQWVSRIEGVYEIPGIMD